MVVILAVKFQIAVVVVVSGCEGVFGGWLVCVWAGWGVRGLVGGMVVSGWGVGGE